MVLSIHPQFYNVNLSQPESLEKLTSLISLLLLLLFSSYPRYGEREKKENTEKSPLQFLLDIQSDQM